MVRLALVGITGYGGDLAQLILGVAEYVGCRLVAVADACLDRVPERADELSGAGIELYDDALVMFEALRGRCDAVCIATGIPSHAVGLLPSA